MGLCIEIHVPFQLQIHRRSKKAARSLVSEYAPSTSPPFAVVAATAAKQMRTKNSVPASGADFGDEVILHGL
ncbi:unnamed protein product [Linum tenue]|uniref:Uncharacterized protein n=1 Tax=Linum tenue TaxID=586396 RepID=A0AAV0Q7I2_9ROSI|nr:unnamed protein product [Linum tenue]